MIFIIADTHFGHTNIIRYCKRPFGEIEKNKEWISQEMNKNSWDRDPKVGNILKEATEEHDEALITNWNSRVGPNDTVYHLGDFSFSGGHPKKYLDRLNGKVSLIMGNHDDSKKVRDAGFEHVFDYRKIRYNVERFILFHYPIAEWDTCHYGSFHLHGHTHGSRDNCELNLKYRTMDVGVDSNNYAPISIEEVLDKLDSREYYPHHS